MTVTGTNVDTGIGTTAVTNADGGYLLPFLTPGSYSVTAELMGFKKLVRQGVAVRIGDRLTLDLALEVGAIAEVVSVTAESPLLDTLSASQGQVIDEKRIALLPLSDGNAFTLARLAPGVAYTGDLKFSRPFDNGGTSGIVSDGASGGNEFTLDGTPNMASGRRVAFVPPAGAVSEFKVETASFDAQQGHTAGATVNVMIKSGTNALKGEGYWYYRDDKLSKNDFFLEDAGRPKAAMSYDRFGGFTGGPILKNRTFFFGAVEWLYDEFPEPGQFTVPTEKMRNGDFSELLAAGITIYDPATAVRRADGRIERQPFPGNIVPASRISPIAREYMQYWPLPNQAGDNQQRNNFLSSNPRTDDFYSVSLRGDHRISSTQSLFVRYTRNDRQEARGNWAGEVNGIRPIGNFLYRVNDGFTGDHVWAISPQRAVEPARRLAAVPGAERAPARRGPGPGLARLPGLDGGRVRPHRLPAALRSRRHLRDRRERGRHLHPQHLFVSADLHAHDGPSHPPRRLRPAPLSGDGGRPGPLGRAVRFRHQLHASARQLSQRARPGSSSRPSSSASRPAARSSATPSARTGRRTTRSGSRTTGA